MSHKKNLATLVPICPLSIGDLARKGWKPHRKRFDADVNGDDFTSSSDDELSISWNSSPGTTEPKDIVHTKNTRHIVTRLNFDDCIIKTNQVSVASVERIVKPSNADDSSLLPQEVDCSKEEGSCQDQGAPYNVISSFQSVGDELTCVPESPNVGAFISKTKRFEGLQFNHSEKTTCSEGSELSSQEILICSPPKCYRLNEHFQVVTPKKEELVVNETSEVNIHSSSPIMQSSRKKKIPYSNRQLYKLQTQNNFDNTNKSTVLIVEDKLLSQKKDSNFSNTFSDCTNGKPVGEKLDIEMSDLASLLLSPVSSQPPTNSSKNISSPVFGSKKKRIFSKYAKDKRLRKNAGSASFERKPLMPVNKNNENIYFQNVPNLQNSVEDSSLMDSEIDYDNKVTSQIYAEIPKSQVYGERKPSSVIVDVTNQNPQIQMHDQLLKSPNIDISQNLFKTCTPEKSFNFQNKDFICTSKDQNDCIIGSQPLTCASGNKLSRRRVKRKLKLTNFTTHSKQTQSHTTWSQTFITQETVTFYCIRNSETINTNLYKQSSQFLDIFKAKSNAQDKISYESQDLQLSGIQGNLLGIDFPDHNNPCLSENKCDESNYAISLNFTPRVSKVDEKSCANARNEVLSPVRELGFNDSVTHTIEETQKNSSGTSVTNDVIECSQVILESSSRAKRLKTNLNKHNLRRFAHGHKFGTRHCVSVASNEHVSVNKSNFPWIKNDILDSSNYIENVTSDEEGVTSPEENNKKVARIVPNPRKTMPDISVESNSENTCNMVVEMNRVCRTPDAKKNTGNCDVTPISVLNSVFEMENISQPSRMQEETVSSTQHISFIESLKSCRISQEEPPQKMCLSGKDESQHISSGSSQDPDHLHCTPPRMTAPPVNMDSGKKRKRLKKDGLAARLQRLLAHKQAATHLCKYEVSVGTRHPGDSVLLVKNAWMEYSRLLVLCSPWPSVEQLQNNRKEIGNGSTKPKQIGAADTEETVMSLWAVVLDSAILPLTQLKENAIIRIYAPWQTMYVPRIGVTLVLDVTYAELVSSTSVGVSHTQTCALCEVDTFHCSCMDGSVKLENCEFQLPFKGKQLWTLLSPALIKPQITLSQTCNMQVATMDAGTQKGTIAEAIMQHSRALTSGIWLNVKVLRVFCYRSLETEDEDQFFNIYNLIWSILGEDSSGECCEVVLGSPCENKMSNEWETIIDGSAIGHLYRIAGLTVSKRLPYDAIHRMQGFLRKSSDNKICPSDSSDISEQQFFYAFSVASEKWNFESKGGTTCGEILPRVVTLSTVLKLDNGSWRHTVLVKALAVWNYNLYIVDHSLNARKDNIKSCYARINMKPSCHLPLSSLTKILCFQDLLIYGGELIADKYCRVFSHENIDTACTSIDVESIAHLKKLSPYIPEIQTSSQIKDLVLVSGCVSGVVGETLKSWPVCKQCKRNLTEQKHHHQLLCEYCGLTEPLTKLSLEIILSCSNLPKLHIKVKLLQKSILSLFPGVLEGTGFEDGNVLEKPIGPLTCVVLENSPSRINCSLSYDMSLQEIQLLEERHELTK